MYDMRRQGENRHPSQLFFLLSWSQIDNKDFVSSSVENVNQTRHRVNTKIPKEIAFIRILVKVETYLNRLCL